MKKISLILIAVLSLSACNTHTKKDEKAKDKKEVVKAEANMRKGDENQTEFVLFQSDYGPKKTYLQIKDYLDSKGMYYPHVIDHQTASKNANVELKPVYLVVFGNPKESGKIIKENPEVALEFPQKALIYQDEEGRTWVIYKKMDYIKNLYSIQDKEGMIKKMNDLMDGFRQAVINPIHTTQIPDSDLE
jgi:uncharacterized protein (DUF302 family)